ncbi:MAG: acetylornithine transaminase [Brevinema sp.]
MNVIDITEKYFMPIAARFPVVLKEGKGCYLYDEKGKKYLDALAGIAVNSLGYAHPKLVEAISNQAIKLMHVSNYFYTEEQARLLATLVEISGMDRCFLSNSGTEAIEGALKLARRWGTRQNSQKYKIITAQNSFHGRTMGALAATAQPKYQEGYEPILEGFSHVAYGDIAALENAMNLEVCAVLLEPIQGESGVHTAPKGYLKMVKELCLKYNALLIVDEIQTGFCRTGKWFAFQHDDILPDIITCAKGIGGGFPLGAFLCTEEVSKAFQLGSHGSTYGGNPLACAASLSVIEVMKSENLNENAEKMGTLLKDGLRNLQSKYPNIIKDIRGCGLLLALDISLDGKDFVKECLRIGLIVNCTGGGTIRLAPPLIVESDHIQEILTYLETALNNMI